MDIEEMKKNNPIEQITEETVATLTEPIQPQYLLLTLEQYNKIAEYFSTVGNSIVKSTDLISELPTHQDLNDLTVQILRPYLAEMRKITGRQAGLNRVFNQGQIIEADGLLERTASQGDQSYDERDESQGLDAVETQTEMGSGWGDIAVDALYLAADITMIGETDNNEKQKPKFVRERKRGQKKSQDSHDDGGMQIKM